MNLLSKNIDEVLSNVTVAITQRRAPSFLHRLKRAYTRMLEKVLVPKLFGGIPSAVVMVCVYVSYIFGENGLQLVLYSVKTLTINIG